MADAAISFAVEKLGNALIQKVIFLKGVEEQVQWLKDELLSMQCFLKDAAEKQAKDERIRKWISDIREVAHDAEDAIEIFILKVDTPRRSRGLLARSAFFPVHLYHVNSVGKEIVSIRRRLDEIGKRRERYGIGNLGEGVDSSRRRSEMVEWRRRLSPWQKDKHVVGLNEDVDFLLKKVILDDQERKGLSLAAIVGMGGIGKSTLARKIYNHATIAARFECRAWVVVSSEFAVEDIIKQIMLQLPISLDHNRLKVVESINDKLRRQEMLQEMLRTYLLGKDYFIVLDDVWEHAHWESLRTAFPDQQDKISRLLFTSRNQIISKHDGYIHKMRFLNPDESWELLLKTAFIGKIDGKCPQELENIGREILKKCHGLPLAITVAGGLLVNQKESKSGWEKVLKQMKNYHMETSEIGTNVSAILELSYHNLPPLLKACFLCLGFFKEDAIIRAKRLVHIWVAQGFVQLQEAGEETVEEIATSYLDELIKRNLVQVKDVTIDDRVKYCHVHDLLRELSIRKAKEEIRFETLIREDEGSSSNSSSYKPRHRVVRYCSGERLMIDSSNQNKHLRSLFIHAEGSRNDAYVSTPSYWKGFELLRILDIEGIRLPRLSSTILGLIGLRYLRLRYVGELTLPSWLDRLKNLEVLDIVSAGVCLPNATWKIDSLRHFYTLPGTGNIFGPLKISSWKNLETLKYISTNNYSFFDNPIQRSSTSRLRKLGIFVVGMYGRAEFARLLVLSPAQLHLKWSSISCCYIFPLPQYLDHLTKLKLQGPMERCPSASSFPQNISHLTLSFSNITTNDPLQQLGKLPKLLYLKLSKGAYKGLSMEVLHNGFPRLKILHLQGLFSLTNIYIEEGGMPELQRLEISNCRLLNTENLREHLTSAVIIITDD